MTLRQTKDHLVLLLSEPQNRVIALLGTWGTGKTHLWAEIQRESDKPTIRNALNVSLFGVPSMSHLRMATLQEALSRTTDQNIALKKLTEWYRKTRNILRQLDERFGAADEAALILLPSLLKGKTIVLDDLERKHKNLEIDEILGFIDEITQRYEARVVMIMNLDKLRDRETWTQLRERVVDQELHLRTAPAEAFEIAIGLIPSEYAPELRAAIETCRLTNIRVIRKVIAVMNRVLQGTQDLTPAILERIVPSTVLLTAIHYNGLNDPPDFEFVLRAGYPRSAQRADDDDAPNAEQVRRMKWDQLLADLRIYSCDQYETVVIDFLQSGLLDSSAVTALVARYVEEAAALDARLAIRTLHEHTIWHWRLSDEQMLTEAKQTAQLVRYLGPGDMTDFLRLLSDIDGTQDLARDALADWLRQFRQRDNVGLEEPGLFQEPLHPEIAQAISDARIERASETSLIDICDKIDRNEGWGLQEQAVLKSAVPSDFEHEMRKASPDRLRIIFRVMLERCADRKRNLPSFGDALDSFPQACRNICADPENLRLAKLIRRLFSSAGLESLLEEPEPPQAEHAQAPGT